MALWRLETAGQPEGDSKAASEVGHEIDLILGRREIDVPVADDQFVDDLRSWVQPSLATSALCVQSLQLLDYELSSHQKASIRDLVAKHWVREEKGFAAVPGGKATVFGCWCARTLIKAAEDLPYGEEGSPGLLRDAIPPQLTADEWRDGLLRCQVGTKGFREKPGEGPVGPVTTDAAIAVLHDIGSPLSVDLLQQMAEYEFDQCIERLPRRNGKSYLVGTYTPREFDSSTRLGDGVATRHVLRKMRWLSREAADDLLGGRLPELLASYAACSGDATRPCVAVPGATTYSVRDTQAWYEVGRLLSGLVGDGLLFPEHVPLEVIEFLEGSQDASGGFGFYPGAHPNILATRAAALIYHSVVSANPALATTMSSLRSRTVDFIESLRILGTTNYRGYATRSRNGTSAHNTIRPGVVPA